MTETACVYTALFGQYERLNEQPIRHESQLRFICFTDDPDLRSDTWDIVLVKPIFPVDPTRSQREYKMLPHRVLPEYSVSLYIDNSVVLKRPPESELALHLSDCDFALPGHSYRRTVLDEFYEVSRLGLDDPSRVFEQLNHYSLTMPSVLEEVPYWCGILFRRHGNPTLRETLELWLQHVYRYSRRDQLSINACCAATGLEPKRLPLDNFRSAFHEWPIIPERDKNRDARSMAASLVPIQLQLQRERSTHEGTRLLLEQETEAHRRTREQLGEELRRTQDLLSAEVARHRYTRETLELAQNSLSWRIMEPFRRMLYVIAQSQKAIREVLGRK